MIFKNCLKHLKRSCFSVLRQKQSCSHGVKNGCNNLQRFNFKPLKPFCLSFEQSFSAWYPLKGHTYINKPVAFRCRFFLSMYDLLVDTRHKRIELVFFCEKHILKTCLQCLTNTLVLKVFRPSKYLPVQI